MKTTGLSLLLLGALAAPVFGQSEGMFLTNPGIEDLSQTKARRFSDFVGRTVLIEFFAYW